MTTTSSETTLEPVTLLMRVWQRCEGFRVEVRALRADERHLFQNKEDLLAYIEALQIVGSADSKYLTLLQRGEQAYGNVVNRASSSVV